MKVGDKDFQTKAFSENEVVDFSKLSGDKNPIHFDKEYASQTRFKKRIVQGPMVVSLIGGILGSTIPGPGTIYLSQETKFMNPVFMDEKVTAWVEIINIREDKPIVTLRTWVEKEDKSLALDGKAVILFLKDLK